MAELSIKNRLLSRPALVDFTDAPVTQSRCTFIMDSIKRTLAYPMWAWLWIRHKLFTTSRHDCSICIGK